MKNYRQYKQTSENIEENSVDLPENLTDTKVQIRPEFYIHIAMINIQKTFLAENAEAGLMQYWVYVEHIQSICDAAGILKDTDYKTNIDNFQKTKFYTEAESTEIQNVRLANEKIRLLLQEVFSNREITSPLKV